MGTTPLICGCKTSNVVQPSPVKPAIQSKPIYQASDSLSKSYSTIKKSGPLIFSEVDTGNGVDLLRNTTSDVNNNNNGEIEQTDYVFEHSTNRSDQRVLDKYDLQSVIGKGSFSKVVQVKNRQTKKLYALKIIDKAKSLETGIPNYERESNILSRVQHPSIITLYEVFHSNAKVYLVLELATGGDLFDRLCTKGHYAEPLAKSTLNMITAGVSYLHHLGIAHRDLKLENLLYKYPGDESQIVISDFGLGHMAEDQESPVGMSTTCGSAEYLAPEVLDGGVYSSAVDMWALGVIAYVVLSGSMPFMDQNRAKLYQKIKTREASFSEQPWSLVTSLAVEFVCKLLEVNPDCRISAEQALNHPWMLYSQS